MVKLWVIRGVLIFLILLCIGGWVDGYGHLSAIGYSGNRTVCWVGSETGSLWLVLVTETPKQKGWWLRRYDIPASKRHILLNEEDSGLRYFWGVGCGHADCDGFVVQQLQLLAIPDYLLILIFSILLYFARWWHNPVIVKRWAIRGLFVLPVVLCVGGWLESCHDEDAFGYDGTPSGFYVASQGGSLALVYRQTPVSPGWWFERQYFRERTVIHTGDRYFLGFGYVRYPKSGWFAVPYYFLVVVFSVFLFFVWRKTGKRKPVGAFPVEAVTRSAG